MSQKAKGYKNILLPGCLPGNGGQVEKIFSSVFVLSLAMSTISCGSSNQEDDTREPDATSPVADNSENQENYEKDDVPGDEEPEDEELDDFVIPESVTYTGSGDDVITIAPFDGAYVFDITGNRDGRYFSVESYDKDGNSVDLLVNTTNPYDGTCIDPTLTTALLEINASGEWSVTLRSLYALDVMSAGMTATDTGDDVLMVDSDSVKTALISGNSDGRYFGITSYGLKGNDLLVNTVDPYEGRVMLKNSPFLFVIEAADDWSITLE